MKETCTWVDYLSRGSVVYMRALSEAGQTEQMNDLHLSPKFASIVGPGEIPLTTSMFLLVPAGSELICESVKLYSRNCGGALTLKDGDSTNCDGSTSWLRGTTGILLELPEVELFFLSCLRPRPKPSPSARASMIAPRRHINSARRRFCGLSPLVAGLFMKSFCELRSSLPECESSLCGDIVIKNKLQQHREML